MRSSAQASPSEYRASAVSQTSENVSRGRYDVGAPSAAGCRPARRGQAFDRMGTATPSTLAVGLIGHADAPEQGRLVRGPAKAVRLGSLLCHVMPQTSQERDLLAVVIRAGFSSPTRGSCDERRLFQRSRSGINRGPLPRAGTPLASRERELLARRVRVELGSKTVGWGKTWRAIRTCRAVNRSDADACGRWQRYAARPAVV